MVKVRRVTNQGKCLIVLAQFRENVVLGNLHTTQTCHFILFSFNRKEAFLSCLTSVIKYWAIPVISEMHILHIVDL